MKINITKEEHEIIRRSLLLYANSVDKAAACLASIPFVHQFREESARARALQVRFLSAFDDEKRKEDK